MYTVFTLSAFSEDFVEAPHHALSALSTVPLHRREFVGQEVIKGLIDRRHSCIIHEVNKQEERTAVPIDTCHLFIIHNDK